MQNYRELALQTQKYFFAKEPKKAIEFGKKALRVQPKSSYIYDILAESYMLIGDTNSAKMAGINALKLKDIQNKTYYSYPLPTSKIKPFNENSTKNIISFSLFGDNPKYCENAIANASIVATIYPFWSCRFYCDSLVPDDVISKLKGLNAKVILKPTTKNISDMLLWRFLVMGDSSIDRYLVRDCDSIINTKESSAVDEWISSKKRFHIMRDFYTHTDLILAGMFGGTTDLFPNIKKMIKDFNQTKPTNRSHIDQLFLRRYIWQTIKKDVLIHDSYFRYNSTKPFPPHPPQPKNHHVGQNEGAIEITVTLSNTIDKESIIWGIYDAKGSLICKYRAKVVDGKWKSHIPMAYAKKLQKKEYFIKSNI